MFRFYMVFSFSQPTFCLLAICYFSFEVDFFASLLLHFICYYFPFFNNSTFSTNFITHHAYCIFTENANVPCWIWSVYFSLHTFLSPSRPTLIVNIPPPQAKCFLCIPQTLDWAHAADVNYYNNCFSTYVMAHIVCVLNVTCQALDFWDVSNNSFVLLVQHLINSRETISSFKKWFPPTTKLCM